VRSPRWAAFLSAAVVAVLVPLSIVGDWIGDDVVSEDGWVENLVPLADDDRIVAAVAGQLTNEAAALAADALDENLPLVPRSVIDGLLEQAVRVITPAVRRIMETDLMARAWGAAVRLAHPQVLALLGRGDTALVDGAEIVLDLTPIADRVREEIDDVLDFDLPFGLSLPEDPLGLARLDLRFELVDLRESEREFGVADDAERRSPLFLGLALLAAAATVLLSSDRVVGLALAAGAAALGPVALLVNLALDRPEDPVGYGIAFDRIVDQATGTARGVALVAGAVLVVTLALNVALRSRRPEALPSFR
jgi:hypothetical protein